MSVEACQGKTYGLSISKLSEIHTFEWFWTITDNVSEADNVFDSPRINVRKDLLEGGSIAMDITDDGGCHDGCLAGVRVCEICRNRQKTGWLQL